MVDRMLKSGLLASVHGQHSGLKKVCKNSFIYKRQDEEVPGLEKENLRSTIILKTEISNQITKYHTTNPQFRNN
jgi:hypothetical protein